MKATFCKPLGLALALTFCAAAARADVKIKTRTTSEGHTSESTVYIKGSRERTETRPGAADILQCDRRQSVEVDDGKKTYTVTSLAGPAATTTAPAGRNAQTPPQPSAGARRGGVVTVTVTTTDLNETKRFPQLGNILARHYRRVMVMESSPDACTPMNMRVESDGWYADVQADLSCNLGLSQMAAAHMARRGCQDRHEYRNVGPEIRGYPVHETTTTTIAMNVQGQQFNRTTTSTQEVVELSSAPLSAALFEVPAGYREVRAESFDTSGDDDAAGNDDEGDNGAANRGGVRGATGSPASPAAGVLRGAGTTTVVAPKKAGVMRVGVAAPNVTAASGLSPAAVSAAVQNSLTTALGGAALEVVTLEARLPEEIGPEAQAKGCDFILYTDVAHKKGGGGGGLGGFLKKAAPVVDAAMGGGSSGGSARPSGNGGTADIAPAVKAKDEVTIDFRLLSAGADGALVAGKTLKGKAKSDGEDIFAPLLQQEAAAVQAEASKK